MMLVNNLIHTIYGSRLDSREKCLYWPDPSSVSGVQSSKHTATNKYILYGMYNEGEGFVVVFGSLSLIGESRFATLVQTKGDRLKPLSFL